MVGAVAENDGEGGRHFCLGEGSLEGVAEEYISTYVGHIWCSHIG